MSRRWCPAGSSRLRAAPAGTRSRTRAARRRRCCRPALVARPGGGVEAQPEQHSEREHLPRFGDRFRDAAEKAIHESALVELLLEFGLVVGTQAHVAAPPRSPP